MSGILWYVSYTLTKVFWKILLVSTILYVYVCVCVCVCVYFSTQNTNQVNLVQFIFFLW